MHDDDLSPAEEAERIIGEEASRHIARCAAALAYMCDMQKDFAEKIGECVRDMLPTLEQLRRVCEDINRYEAESIAALEDDFYGERGNQP